MSRPTAPGLPTPADFAPPPTPADRARWAEADRAARPARLDRLRARFEASGIDAYFGMRREHMRYLTGFALADGEEKVAGTSGQFLVSGDEVVLLADSRYTIQAKREAPDARIVDGPRDLAQGWHGLVAVDRREAGRRRGGSRAVRRLAPARGRRAGRRARPGRGLDRGRSGRSRSRRSSSGSPRPARSRTGRSRRSCRRSARARPSSELALDLEWRMRTGGAEAIAFDPTCLVGPNAALPHGSPSDAVVQTGQVVLFDFGAQVDGYRSDMTRTLFVGEPTERDLAVYELVAKAQAAVIGQIEATRRRRARRCRRAARSTTSPAGVIEADGRWPAYGHGLGHGIGLATHELPSLGSHAPGDAPAVADGLLRRARDLPRGRDRRPDRGPRPARRRRRPRRAPDAVPARGHGPSGLSGQPAPIARSRRRERASGRLQSAAEQRTACRLPRALRRTSAAQEPTRHDQHR